MKSTDHCRVELDQDTVVVTPVRDLSELDCSLFARDIGGVLRLLEQQRAQNVIIDFSRTKYFGSDAIYLFLKLYRRVQANQGRMAFCGMSPFEQDVLSVMALDRLWPICPTRSDALDSVSHQSVDILVVDDSEVDRRLAGGLLAKNPDYRIHYADNGRTALMEMSRDIPDLVVTDLIMPQSDGLQLVGSIRKLYPQVPVILMTAYGNEAIASEALERGAASYVPKSQQAERLTETVERVLARLKTHRIRQRLRNCPGKVECSCYLGNEVTLISPVVDLIQHNLAAIGAGDAIEQLRISIAVEEALFNALYHGNLEISATELHRARDTSTQETIDDLLKTRRQQDELRDRCVVVHVQITPQMARFVVRDEGPGFDRAAAPGSASACFEHGTNRGTMLMYSFMDDVQYNETGNEVTMTTVP